MKTIKISNAEAIALQEMVSGAINAGQEWMKVDLCKLLAKMDRIRSLTAVYGTGDSWEIELEVENV